MGSGFENTWALMPNFQLIPLYISNHCVAIISAPLVMQAPITWDQQKDISFPSTPTLDQPELGSGPGFGSSVWILEMERNGDVARIFINLTSLSLGAVERGQTVEGLGCWHDQDSAEQYSKQFLNGAPFKAVEKTFDEARDIAKQKHEVKPSIVGLALLNLMGQTIDFHWVC